MGDSTLVLGVNIIFKQKKPADAQRGIGEIYFRDSIFIGFSKGGGVLNGGGCNWEALHFLRKLYESISETTGNYRGKIWGTPLLGETKKGTLFNPGLAVILLMVQKSGGCTSWGKGSGYPLIYPGGWPWGFLNPSTVATPWVVNPECMGFCMDFTIWSPYL